MNVEKAVKSLAKIAQNLRAVQIWNSDEAVVAEGRAIRTGLEAKRAQRIAEKIEELVK